MPGALKRLFQRAGLEVTRFPAPGTLSWQLKQVVRLRSVDGVVDVGAHWGEFAKSMRRDVGYEGPIVSYEPSSQSFARLAATMAGDPKWSGHRIALGSEAGVLDLNVFASTDFSSFRRPNALGSQRFDIVDDHMEHVEVRRLDETLSLPGHLLLKTDTQGFDLEVLRGATGILPRVTAVVTELSVRNIYEGSPRLTEMIEHLVLAGFEIVGLFPVSRDSDRLRVIEFDGVFLRSG